MPRKITHATALEKFVVLSRLRARVELALLDSMVTVYGSEKKADEVASLPDFERFVLADLWSATRKAHAAYKIIYDAAIRASHKKRRKENHRG